MSNHLIIGLGGTGGSVIRALRKRIYEEFRSNTPEGKAHVEYLYVDSSLSDLNDTKSWQTMGASVQLTPSQRLSINGISASVLSNLEAFPGIEGFISKKDQSMLNDGIGAIISDGIGGQRRRFGRMLMANNMCGLPQETFLGRVHTRVAELKRQEDTNNVTFHICAGLGGGTGSGSIVDAVAQIRNAFKQNGDNKKYQIFLYLYVPEQIIQIPGGKDSNRYYQPNGYAALLELNAMSVRTYLPTDVKGNKDEYGKVVRLLKGEDAFDMAYLYSNVNEPNEHQDSKEVNIHSVLPSIVGDFLFQKIIAGSMDGGGQMARLMNNENNGLLPEKNEADEPVHSRRFMCFGVKRVEYPETEVVEYGAYQFARQASLQMLNGLWDDARGFLDECTEDMVGKTYKQDVAKDKELQENLMTDDMLSLSVPLPSIEKHVKWKPIGITWQNSVDAYKQDVQSEYGKKEWLEEFNQQCDQYYDSMYRGCGVKKFYQDYTGELAGFAEEITRHIENRLFAKWKNGEMSIIEVHKYVSTLIAYLDDRVGIFKEKASKGASLITDNLEVDIKGIRNEWNNIGWLKDAITNASTKVFGRFADAKRDQLNLSTKVEGYLYAAKLAAELKNMLTLLNMNVVEPLRKMMADFAERMNELSAAKCKLSDAEEASLSNEVVKEYDPKVARNAVADFLKNKENQANYATALRGRIVEAAGTATPSFTALANKLNVGVIEEVAIKECINNVRRDMEDFSVKNPTQKLVGVNILEKLRSTECSTPEKMNEFIKKLYDAAQSFLVFNKFESGQGSPETAANHRKMIQLSLPAAGKDDEQWRNQFIEQFAASGSIDFKKENDVANNYKSNQIVVVAAHSGFPLRYVENVKVLKEEYDIVTRNEVDRMVVHTESFTSPLPSLFNKGKDEAKKDLLPVVILAYAMEGLLTERENPETGEKSLCFPGAINMMGIVSEWIAVGNNIVDSLDEMAKQTRAKDAARLRALVKEKLDADYKHIEKKKGLMLAMGQVLVKQVLPLVGGNDKNQTYIDFNKAAEKLCVNEFKF